MKKNLGMVFVSLFLLTGLTGCNGDSWEYDKANHWHETGGDDKQDFGLHTFKKDEASCKDATCTEKGLIVEKCTECGYTRETYTPMLPHEFVKDPINSKDPTCLEEGKFVEKCSHCSEIKTTPIAPLGHIFSGNFNVRGEGEENAAVTKQTCDKGDVVRYTWAAQEITTKCEEGYDRGEGDQKVHEPNVTKQNNGGIQFWGRPKGNAVVLDKSGNASMQNHTPVYDATVEGSYIEYKFTLSEAISGAKLISDIAPGGFLDAKGGMFKAVGLNGDWTVGLKGKNDDGSLIAYGENDWRVEVIIDGKLVTLKGEQEAAAGRKYYHFPTDGIDLTAGEHTLKLVMAGGWKHTYYRFGFECAVAK